MEGFNMKDTDKFNDEPAILFGDIIITKMSSIFSQRTLCTLLQLHGKKEFNFNS